MQSIPRLPRYSLRTFFIVVTLLALFIGYHVDWMQQRDRLIREVDNQYERIGVDWSFYTRSQRPPQRPRAPQLLWLFGERGAWDFNLVIHSDEMQQLSATDVARVKHAKSLFPEARVGVVKAGHRRDGTLDIWELSATQLEHELNADSDE